MNLKGQNMFFGVEDLKTDEIFLKLTKTCEEQPEKRWLPAYYLIITCDPVNVASYKTCEHAGGIFIETANIPEDNEMYAEGKRKVKIYRFDI